MVVADRVDEMLVEAHTAELKGRFAAAELLFCQAIAYSPRNMKSHVKQGRYYFGLVRRICG